MDPLSDLYKIWHKVVPDPHPHAKCHHCGFRNVGGVPQIVKISNFWYILPQRDQSLNRFFYIKFGFGERVPGPHSHTKFHHCGFKIWTSCRQKSSKFAMFVHICPLGKILGVHKNLNIGAQQETFLYATTP